MSSNLSESHFIESLHSEPHDNLREINLCSIAIGLINVLTMTLVKCFSTLQSKLFIASNLLYADVILFRRYSWLSTSIDVVIFCSWNGLGSIAAPYHPDLGLPDSLVSSWRMRPASDVESRLGPTPA
jgi:hypothetical protein